MSALLLLALFSAAWPTRAVRLHVPSVAWPAREELGATNVSAAESRQRSAACDRLQERFLRLDKAAKQRIATMRRENTTTLSAVASLTVTFQGMMHSVRRAHQSRCPLFADEGAAGVGRRAREVAAQHPCLGAARREVREAAARSGGGGEYEFEADQRAMLMLLSPSCEVSSPDEAMLEGDPMTEEAEAAEEEAVLEEVDGVTDELLGGALGGGVSLFEVKNQLDASQVELVVGTIMAIFFGLWLLLALPLIVGAACLITGVGFLVFSFLGCLLYNLVRLLLGLSFGSCPMFNWLPLCSFDPVHFRHFGHEYMH